MNLLLLVLIGLAAVAAAIYAATFPMPRWRTWRLALAGKLFGFAAVVTAVGVLASGLPVVAGGMPARKGQAWIAPCGLPALALGAAADTSSFTPYWFNPNKIGVYDPEVEYVLQAWLMFEGTVTGVVTNNFSIVVTHYNVLGAVVDQVTYNFGAGINAVAFVPIDLTIGAGGAMTVNSGVSILAGWTLAPGDILNVKRLTVGTGLASPAFGVGFTIGRKA